MGIKQRILAHLVNENRLQKYPILRRLLWKRGPIFRRLEQLAARMRKKEVITVAFMVLDLPCWKCDPVFRLMQAHPRFRPVIWIVPGKQIKDTDELQRILQEMRSYFAERGYPVAELLSLHEMRERYAPDIVFLPKPYLGAVEYDAWSMDRELVCYVPYCFQNTKKEDFLFLQENQLWRNFYATLGVYKICTQIMANAAANVAITGAPVADEYLFPHAPSPVSPSPWKPQPGAPLKLIWAPHWSVGGNSWFNVSTFLEVAEGMLSLAEKYAGRVQWAFKPHPLLRDTLYRHSAWGKERTDAYYARWASMPCTQLETGAYVQLFKESDAMVHDSGSFIMEYLLVNKPCLYLQAEDGFADFNEDTRQALACYRKGRSVADVEQFLLDLLAQKPDSLAAARTRYRKRILTPPHGCSAAQNIVDYILYGR